MVRAAALGGQGTDCKGDDEVVLSLCRNGNLLIRGDIRCVRMAQVNHNSTDGLLRRTDVIQKNETRQAGC